ncbi:NAD(P)/FAD-dependent oxidoreductase [Gillisia sp. Q332]|uniref:NAD(P)/FAD-dependent oxidoreductase n=1 Tax=Gillisia xinjiangensis TaxID=3384765 RepID=UPI00391C657F
MKKADIGIVGGGIAGLTAAIHLASCGLKVLLFEKEKYPHHKVCGEYLSREILPYLKSLNISLESLQPKIIDQLLYSTPSGKTIKTDLKSGGFGISRYALDNYLYEKAKEQNVDIIHQTVTNTTFENEFFEIRTFENQAFPTKIVLGAFGKRSGLDKKLNRQFIEKKSGWLAVKAHYKLDDYPNNRVSLHNFKGGYCGLSKTETDSVNVCYLASYESFKNYKSIDSYKEEVLCRNPQLKTFFHEAVPLFETDLSIAQISFEKKSLVEDHILMLGDAAGLIHPLCGNGMAMAFHSAKLASESILKYYNPNAFSRTDIEKEYIKKWDQQFKSRMKIGSALQKILLKPFLAEASQNIIKIIPSLLPFIIAKTHGKPVI